MRYGIAIGFGLGLLAAGLAWVAFDWRPADLETFARAAADALS